MTILFFIPLCIIAVYEAELDPSKNKWVKDWLSHPDEGLVGSAEDQDPEVDGEDAAKGLKIRSVPFSELITVFPDALHVGSSMSCLSRVLISAHFSPARRSLSRKSGISRRRLRSSRSSSRRRFEARMPMLKSYPNFLTQELLPYCTICLPMLRLMHDIRNTSG